MVSKLEKVAFVEMMKSRTKQLGLNAIRTFKRLPKNEESKIIGRQFLRSALFVGANYRAACRGRSRAEFFSKLSISVEEADEVLFWVEIMEESKILNIDASFKKEIEEILAILSKARKNTK